jgi:hypothetical protein
MLGGWFPPTHIFVGKTTAIMPRNFDILIAITILGDMLQIETILLVLQHPRWPNKQVRLGDGILQHILASIFGEKMPMSLQIYHIPVKPH